MDPISAQCLLIDNHLHAHAGYMRTCTKLTCDQILFNKFHALEHRAIPVVTRNVYNVMIKLFKRMDPRVNADHPSTENDILHALMIELDDMIGAISSF